jgi:para-aminobenzoate synthetase component 1
LHQLPYQPDPLPLLAALRPLGRAVLLHSAARNHRFAGLDIVAAAPRVVVETRGASTTVQGPEGTRISGADPFELLDEILEREAAVAGTRAPFAGGVIGLAGYDLGRRCGRLGDRLPASSGFPDLVAGFYDWVIATDHGTRRTRVHALPGRRTPEGLLGQLASLPAVRRAPLPQLLPEVGRSAYAEAFDRIQAWIRAGDCYQVNLAVPFSAPCEEDALALYAALTDRQPSPYAAFLETPAGAVLSCSPERLLHCEDGTIHTSPIKGTRRRHRDPVRDAAEAAALLASEKDRAENLMIVDLLRNDLGRSCLPGTVRVPELFELQSFPAVHHLVSTIRGELAPGVSPLTALGRAFPGGSVTGAPKLRAMQIIEALEPRRRGPYCGSVFRVDPAGRLDASITIRTLLLEAGRLTCWGGGGIVADSDAAAEWAEIHAKIGALIGAEGHLGDWPAQPSKAAS